MPRSGDLPLIYPFLVNDPGEGTQAKRRVHATLVDHLVPPMARAETYGDIARLEQLLDEHAHIAALDPAKLPGNPRADLDADAGRQARPRSGLAERPHDDEFDDFVLHVDGWLCEIKDAQIRDGLHILGQAPDRRGAGQPGARDPAGPADVGRAGQRAAGAARALGLVEDGTDDAPPSTPSRHRPARWSRRGGRRLGSTRPALHAAPTTARAVAAVLTFAATEVVPRLAGTTEEIPQVLHALDGGFIPAGPSGSPLRGLVNVLPTGRNFYSVDPKAVPSRLAWETGAGDGRVAAGAVPRRHRRLPAVGGTVGLGHLGHAHRPATTSPRCLRCSGCGRCGTRRRAGSSTRADRARRARPAPDRRHRPDLAASSATPSRTSWRCSTTPCGWSPTSTSPPS